MTDQRYSTTCNGTTIGWARYADADFQGASSAFKQAVAARPEDHGALHGLGRLYLIRNELTAATIVLERALALLDKETVTRPESNNVELQRDLAWAYHRLGRFDLAAPLLARVPGQDAIARFLHTLGDHPGYVLPHGFRGAEIPLAAVEPIPLVEVGIRSSTYLFAIDTGVGDVIVDARLAVGTNFLARFRPTFDFAHARLTLHPRETAHEPAAGERAIDFWLFEDHILLVRGAIEKNETMLAIASGIAGAALVIPQSTVERAGLSAALRSTETLTGVSSNGIHSAVPFTAREVRLGPITRRNVEGLVDPFFPNLEHRFRLRVSGVIGHDFMRPYRWTIDWTRMNLWIGSA